MQNTGDKSPTPSSSGMKWVKRIVRAVVIVLVIWGIARTLQKANRDLVAQQNAIEQQLSDFDRRWQERQASGVTTAAEQHEYTAARHKLEMQRFKWSRIRMSWLLIGGVLYFCGTLPGWSYWHLTLLALKQNPAPSMSLRAYTVGQLGKYVPGKALVVILRANGVSGPRVDWFVAAAAVFIETLTSIAVGAALSGILLVILFRNDVHPGLLAAAIGLMLVAWLPTIPTIFRWIVTRLQRNTASQLQAALAGVNRSLIARGWIIMPIGWLFMGLSLWAVAQAIPAGTQQTLLPSVQEVALHVACIALAVVLGFASFIPGGFGVRELVVTTVLAPTYGTVRALIVAILLRLVSLAAELIMSGVLIVLTRLRPASQITTDP